MNRKTLTEERRAQIEAALWNGGLSLPARAALRLKLLLEEEEIVRVPGERIYGYRTIADFPDIYAPGEKEKLQSGHYVHEQGRVCNISSDWEGVLREGLLPRRERALEALREGRGDPEFCKAAVTCADAVIAYADRYEDTALANAVRYGATDFLSALQAMRILHLALWASNVYHNTLGRFDQYMLPYYLDADMEREEALELLCEFFLSFNRDSELYTGMQRGDNGQSLMLGGCTREGKRSVNELTELCLEASLKNRKIDPKINLRVDKDTPASLYELGTRLTKQGLGFPQYSNDDVVIPGLAALGYELEDARDYTVAACWEFIVPGVGMDIPNIAAMPLAKVVSDAIRAHLADCADFAALEAAVALELKTRASSIAESLKNLWMEPAPYQSLLMRGCVEAGRDISQGLKYNNYGFHGTGFADATDQLAAVRKLVFEEKRVSASELLRALEANFEGFDALKTELRTCAPKLGRDEEAEPVAEMLLAAFADALAPLRNERGGIFRAGTGSAMYYLWHAEDLPALSDGLMPGEKLPANYSPSLLLRDAGPVSVVRGFARKGLGRCINGGPLTLELHDTVFRNDEGVKKTAALVRAFIQLGGHQMQLNAVSREQLEAAQKDPGAYENLIVRVWGWSGQFVKLDKAYQDHILSRASYNA